MDSGEEKNQDPYTQRLNQNFDKQIKEQREVVAMKRQALSQQRIDIIKGQTQSWAPHTRQSQVFEQHKLRKGDVTYAGSSQELQDTSAEAKKYLRDKYGIKHGHIKSISSTGETYNEDY